MVGRIEMSVCIRWLLLFVACVAAKACTGDPELCVVGSRLSVLDESVHQELVAVLEASDVSFQLDNEGRICYSVEDRLQVRSLLIELETEPQQRSNRIRIPGQRLGLFVIEALEAEDIALSYVFDEDAVEYQVEIESESDMEKARRIYAEAVVEFSDN